MPDELKLKIVADVGGGSSGGSPADNRALKDIAKGVALGNLIWTAFADSMSPLIKILKALGAVLLLAFSPIVVVFAQFFKKMMPHLIFLAEGIRDALKGPLGQGTGIWGGKVGENAGNAAVGGLAAGGVIAILAGVSGAWLIALSAAIVAILAGLVAAGLTMSEKGWRIEIGRAHV